MSLEFGRGFEFGFVFEFGFGIWNLGCEISVVGIRVLEVEMWSLGFDFGI